MKRFATDEIVTRLRARAAGLVGVDRATILAELAWHERQRDTRCALALADEAETMLADAAPAAGARLQLVRAEAAWLYGDLDASERHLERARAAGGDEALQSDADWLESSLVSDRGRYDARRDAIARSGEHAEHALDAERFDLARLALQCFDAFAEPAPALAAHGGSVRARLDDPDPGVAALAHGFMQHGLCAIGQYAEAIRHGLRAAELARQSGQIRRALIDTANAASICFDLGDFDGALTLLDDTLARARAAGWPREIASVLSTMALVLMKVGRGEAAAALADEALAVLAPIPDAKTWHIAAQARASIALEQAQWATARALCETILAAAMDGDMLEMRRFACQGLAEALLGAGDAAQARERAGQALALALAGGDLPSQIDAHRLLARIARQETQADGNAPHPAALAALQSALALADAHPDLRAQPALLDELATELWRARRHEEAFATLQRSAELRDALARHEVAQHAVALEVRFKTEQALADARRQRELAEAEAQRAGELAEVNDRLRAALADLEAAQVRLEHRNAELRAAYAATADLSLTDPLTGLRNRRFLTQAIDQDISHTVRQHEIHLRRPPGGADARADASPHGAGDLLFFLIDIDDFKAVNDTYGHSCGDEVLLQYKDRLRAVFRDSDHIVRWGGEEFLIVARDTRRECAAQLAERLRQEVADQPFALNDGQRLSSTCSIGWASFPPNPAQPRQSDWMDIIELADRRLYQAKAGGRNRCVGDAELPGATPAN